MTQMFTSLQLEVLSYLRANVNATETAEGVNRMWLGRPRTSESVAEVEEALEGLVTLDLIEKHALPGGRVVYRSPQRRGV